jgi:hypothetical protein
MYNQGAIINGTVGGRELKLCYVVQYFIVDPQSEAVCNHVAGEEAAPTQCNWSPTARFTEKNVWQLQVIQIRQGIGR